MSIPKATLLFLGSLFVAVGIWVSWGWGFRSIFRMRWLGAFLFALALPRVSLRLGPCFRSKNLFLFYFGIKTIWDRNLQIARSHKPGKVTHSQNFARCCSKKLSTETSKSSRLDRICLASSPNLRENSEGVRCRSVWEPLKFSFFIVGSRDASERDSDSRELGERESCSSRDLEIFRIVLGPICLSCRVMSCSGLLSLLPWLPFSVSKFSFLFSSSCFFFCSFLTLIRWASCISSFSDKHFLYF